MIRALEAISNRYGVPIVNFGHAGDGNIHVNVMVDLAEAGMEDKVRSALHDIFPRHRRPWAARSAASTASAPPRPPISAWNWTHPNPGRVTIKKALDPNNIMNPGKIFLEDQPEPGATAGQLHDLMAELKTLEDYPERNRPMRALRGLSGPLPGVPGNRTGRFGGAGQDCPGGGGAGRRSGLDERAKEISLCLLCGSCVVKCPNHTPTDAIVGALRRQITETHGLTPIGKGIGGADRLQIAHQNPAQGRGPAVAAAVQRSRKPAACGCVFPGVAQGTQPAAHSERNLFSRVPICWRRSRRKPTVGVAGCALTYLYPQVGELLVRLPHSLGYSVFTPRDQGCCGMPALSSGNGPLIDKLADANLKAFAGRKIAAILTGCASCHGVLAGHSAEKAGNPF